VVAGVIGMKRFQYDLWGDAVNTASRMETQGEPGKIQITRATYEQLNGEFVCRPRGSVSIKGKGEMQTWYLDGVRTPDAVGARVEANA
jgi:class 3 adenylate cyclase